MKVKFAIALALVLLVAGGITLGWQAEHNRDLRGEPERDDDSDFPIAIFLPIGVALYIATQNKRAKDADRG